MVCDEAYTSVCRRHPDVVAAFESPHGRVALLLRQTLTPPSEERSRWLVETRRAAHEVTTSLLHHAILSTASASAKGEPSWHNADR
jgi:hypothetical protein